MRCQLLAATWTVSRAARNPRASFTASSFAQKCTKKSRGSSSSMWLWSAVTSIPYALKGLQQRLHLFRRRNEIPADGGVAVASRFEIDGDGGSHGGSDRIPPARICSALGMLN